MNDPEKFLTRWSRRKRDALDESTRTAPADAVTDAAPDNESDRPADKPALEKPAEPAFDPASLPSLDSIGAQTDIRNFLQPGVPPDLTRAALRRAWTADPAIRDFKGLQENDWDFNDPNAMAGFGNLDPDFDVNRMLASVFGETPKEAPEPSVTDADGTLSASNEDESTQDRAEVARVTELSHTDTDAEMNVVRRSMNVASQEDDVSAPVDQTRRPRTHGSALPRCESD